MKFLQGLNEYSDDIQLDKWNSIQRLLWKDVCDDEGWDVNDVDRFVKFATFFDLYYKSKKKFPSVSEIEDAIL